MTDPSDLTNEELDRIVRRLHLAFQRRPLLPMQSLQYRLGETGHPRIHSYALKRALGVLGRKLTPRGDQGISHRPWMVAPSVFASGDLDKDAATSLLREQEEHLGALANCDWSIGYNSLARAIGEHVGEFEELESHVRAVDSILVGTRLISGQAGLYRLAPDKAGTEIRLLITQQIDPLGPADPQLWRALHACQETDSRLLIIARCIDPASFVLFKALGVRGLQFYNMWAPQRDLPRIKAAADEIGWFNTKGSQEVLAHQILHQLSGALKYLRQSQLDPNVNLEIERARDTGLTLGSRPAPAALIGWAEQNSLDLPEAWINTIRRFRIWTGDTPLKARHVPTGPVRSTRPSTKRNSTPPPEASMQGAITESTQTVPLARPNPTVSRVPIRGW